MEKEIVVIGAGPAGLSTAYHLEGECLLLEKENRIGGLMRSKVIDGFIFDYAGHIFFTQDDYALNWVKKMLGDNLHFQYRESFIFSKGVYTRYPFQANTFGLPIDVVKECLLGFIEARYEWAKVKPTNFYEWIYITFGKGIAEHFMIPYNQKVWTYPLEEMACDWLMERVPQPKIEDVIEGALKPSRKNLGPNSLFGYPLYGGCESIPRAISPFLKRVRVNSEVVEVRSKEKALKLKDGSLIPYDILVSTIPTPKFIKMFDLISDEVLKASQGLKGVSVVCANIGVKLDNPTEKHWIYFPEPEFLTHRIFIQGNASPYVCPPGHFSFTNEISYSHLKKIEKENVIEKSVDDLIRAGLIQSKDQVVVTDLIDLEDAYVVYDHKRQERMKVIKNFLEKMDIYLCGRFAEWEYYNMDHSFIAGKRMAEKIKAKYL